MYLHIYMLVCCTVHMLKCHLNKYIRIFYSSIDSWPNDLWVSCLAQLPGNVNNIMATHTAILSIYLIFVYSHGTCINYYNCERKFAALNKMINDNTQNYTSTNPINDTSPVPCHAIPLLLPPYHFVFMPKIIIYICLYSGVLIYNTISICISDYYM